VSYVPAEALSLIAEVANRPIVVSTETFVGRGAVGGFVVTPAAVGQDAARLAARILDGADVSALAASANSVNKPVFDWRELRRWGISESQLPQGSDIRFREPTLWQQYRGQILAIWAVVLAQAAMIAWLLNEQHRRRRSEAAAHELSGLLIKAQEEERSRLARELHDDVTQRLAVLAIEAGREERKSAGAGGATLRPAEAGPLVAFASMA
jgi:signal transduction histidine kinase